MNPIVETLARIMTGLVRLQRRELMASLGAGKSPKQVRSLLTGSMLPESESLEALYSWKNGTKTALISLDDSHLLPGFYLLSLEDALHNYRAFVADSRWRQGWLPLFANGGGDFYVVDFCSEPSGAVRHFKIEETEHPVEFKSLDDMLTTVATAFDREVIFVDAAGYLEMDDAAFAAVAAKFNPDVSWWRD